MIIFELAMFIRCYVITIILKDSRRFEMYSNCVSCQLQTKTDKKVMISKKEFTAYSVWRKVETGFNKNETDWNKLCTQFGYN